MTAILIIIKQWLMTELLLFFCFAENNLTVSLTPQYVCASLHLFSSLSQLDDESKFF